MNSPSRSSTSPTRERDTGWALRIFPEPTTEPDLVSWVATRRMRRLPMSPIGREWSNSYESIWGMDPGIEIAAENRISDGSR